MEKFLDFVNGFLPDSGDSVLNLLIFFLVVFGGLYVFFQLIFYLTRERKVEEKKEKDVEKKVEEKPKKEKPPPKIKVIKVKPAKKEKIIVKENDMENLVFLEREKPEEEPNPYYRNDNHQSYIIGSYSQGEEYSYGDNYLHNYYNDGKTVKYTNETQTKPEIEPYKYEEYRPSEVDRVATELKSQSDNIVNTYIDMPTELKKYILYKMFMSEIEQ